MSSIIMIFTSNRSLELSNCFKSFSEKSSKEQSLNFINCSENGPKSRCGLQSLPWESWIRWMAEKLKTSAFFFFLCFCQDIQMIKKSLNIKLVYKVKVAAEVPWALSWPYPAFSYFWRSSFQWSIWPSGLLLMGLPSEKWDWLIIHPSCK